MIDHIRGHHRIDAYWGFCEDRGHCQEHLHGTRTFKTFDGLLRHLEVKHRFEEIVPFRP